MSSSRARNASIPQPRVTAVHPEDRQLAKKIEAMLLAQIRQRNFKEMNDEQERTVPIQGGDFWHVEWDPEGGFHCQMGDLSVELRHPKQVIPQPGVYDLEKMDYLFVLVSQSRRALEKRYGAAMALDHIDLALEPGRIVGLLGPNGSGKSTLVKLAMGLLQPTSGEVLIGGQAPSPQTNAVVSYLPDRITLSPWMKTRQLLDFYGDFFADFDRAAAERMLSQLGLDLTLENGQQVIDLKQQKTGNHVVIPIRPELQAILEKYDNRLPRTYEQKVNLQTITPRLPSSSAHT